MKKESNTHTYIYNIYISNLPWLNDCRSEILLLQNMCILLNFMMYTSFIVNHFYFKSIPDIFLWWRKDEEEITVGFYIFSFYKYLRLTYEGFFSQGMMWKSYALTAKKHVSYLETSLSKSFLCKREVLLFFESLNTLTRQGASLQHMCKKSHIDADVITRLSDNHPQTLNPHKRTLGTCWSSTLTVRLNCLISMEYWLLLIFHWLHRIYFSAYSIH